MDEVFYKGDLPVIALLGRPNTGKSTLFNRLTRSKRAVVDSMPGVTRDRNIAATTYDGRDYLLVDTGGFEEHEDDDLARAVRAQSLLAAEEADAIIVVVDGRAGLNALDQALFDEVRRIRKPTFVAVNKIDVPSVRDLVADFYALGVSQIYPVSAEHGVDIGVLMDDVLASVPESPTTEDEDAEAALATRVAIIGRPNVGKSSLLNRLVGYDRSIVSAIPGTTRDPLDTQLKHGERNYVLVDTAGIRRRPKVHEYVEKASVVRALRALERSQIVLLLIDAVEGITEQDARISSYAWERGRAMGLIVNKWDAVDDSRKLREDFSEKVDHWFPSFGVVPRIFISALTGRGVAKVWTMVEALSVAHGFTMQTARLNEVIEHAEQAQAPPLVRGKRPRLYYATQTGTHPPTVTVFTSLPGEIQESYQRYLQNQLRAAFPFEGTPIRLRFRARRAERKN